MRKPQVRIVRSTHKSRPWLFLVKWPGNHWKNSQWFSFEEALVAAGVKTF
jgi:hypothetical protein